MDINLAEKNISRAKSTLLLTNIILFSVCLLLEITLSYLNFKDQPETRTFKWIFRWIILTNIINLSIILIEYILIRIFRKSNTICCYIMTISICMVCTTISCQHYFFVPLHLIFAVPILLSVPLINRRLNIIVDIICLLCCCISFYVRSLDSTVLRNFWADFSICIVYILVFSTISYQLVHYLYNQNMHLIKAINRAEKASYAKSDFISNMSHEIRTPINSILGMNEMILRESTEPAIQEYAENILSSGNALLSLVNDILDLSKIESGKVEIINADYNLKNLIQDTVTMIHDRIESKHLSFEVNCDPNLPSVIFGDSTRIRQILINFLTNAAKYTREGKITYSISGTIQKQHVALSFSIKDTGSGIKEEDLKKIYGRFERFDIENNRSIEGTGLGLRISKNLANLMNAKIDVKSEYGVGSEFILNIVQKIVLEEPIGKVSFLSKRNSNRKKYQVSFTAPDARILVVDDIDMNLLIIENLLKMTGMKIDTAESGNRCLRKASEEKYDLIIIDHMMPGMDGIETFHKLKSTEESKNKDTPVIMLTANVFPGAYEQYAKEGFVDYISKPIDCIKLEKTISSYLPKDKVKFL